MEINLNIRDPSGLSKSMDKLPYSVVRQQQLAVKKGLRDIQSTARMQHTFISRTGNTERAIDTMITNDNPPTGKVFLNPALSPHGQYVHEGTGIYADRTPYFILPKHKKMLRWAKKDGSGFVFAKQVLHWGQKPDQFIYDAAKKNEPNIQAMFELHTLNSIKEAGL